MVRISAAAVAGGAACLVAMLGNRLAVDRASSGSVWIRPNHAGSAVTLAEGPVAVVATLTGVLLTSLLPRGSVRVQSAVAMAAVGSGALGAYDDLHGTARAKGFRGHLAALRSGTITSGVIKVAGVGASAAVASWILGRRRSCGPAARLAGGLVDTALIAGTANFINLCDLRPGRAAKVAIMLSVGFAGRGAAPVLGAAAATVAAASLPLPMKVMALFVVAALNLASERVSFTAVIDRSPLLRWLDQLGRG